MKKLTSLTLGPIMKKLMPLLALVAVCMALAPGARATPTQLLTITINNTTNTVTGIAAWPYNQVLQNAIITHGPLTNLTSMRVDIYMNAPNSTTTNGRIFLGSWYPSTTNTASETVTGSNYGVTNYLSFDICTTNAVPLNGTYGQ